MTHRPALLPGKLHELLDANFSTGDLTWRARTPELIANDRVRAGWNTKFAGKPALTHINQGYRVGSVLKQVLLAHRVIWAMRYGAWPESQIDHIDGDRLNNSIDNLRSVSHADNVRNAKLSGANTSGANGVQERYGKWQARIPVDGRNVQLGTFSTFGEALAARIGAEIVLGFHPNHGRRS